MIALNELPFDGLRELISQYRPTLMRNEGQGAMPRGDETEGS